MFILSWLFGGGDNSRALREACKGDLPQVKKLIAEGADVDGEDKEGVTALTMAIVSEQVEIVETLLAAGADPNRRNKSGLTPLSSLRQTLLHLEIYGDSVSERSYRPSPRRTQIVQLLLKAGAAAEGASEKTNTAGMSELAALAAGTLYGVGVTHLMFAAERGDVELAKCFLNAGADVNRVADKGGQVTALCLAAAFGHAEMARLLIERGANVNFRSQDGVHVTPLMHAAMSDYPDVVRVLLAAGADKSLKTTEGHTALDMARLSDCRAIVALLK